MSNDQQSQLNRLYDMQKEDSRLDGLRRPGVNFVPGTGPFNPSIMLVGMAPGRMENGKLIPFIGRAGDNLNNILQGMGVAPHSVFMTNVSKYWTRDPNNPHKLRDLTTEEAAACRQYISAEIEIVNPTIVGLMGRAAIQSVFPEISNVYDVHGTLIEDKFIPLYHPAVWSWEEDKQPLIRAGYSALKTYALIKRADSLR